MDISLINYKYIILVTTTAVICVSCENCHRSLSRIVRNEIQKKILPHYLDMKIAMPDECPLNPNRDVYLVQEEKVVEESTSNYKCNFCGKAFISRYYIDLHFDNRHPEYVRQDTDALCFADLCDVARCDIIGGWRKADFWEVSLCLEDDMKELAEKCHDIMQQCIPSGLTKKEEKELNKRLNGLCSFLTCKLYWDGPPKQDSDGVVMYSVLSVFVAIFLIIYYCLAYHYFYTDTFSDTDGYIQPKQTFPGIQPKSSNSRPRRQRYYQGQLYDADDDKDDDYDEDDEYR